jgi:hypothetical protein
VLTAGPTVFPPVTALPGSVADERYSPLIMAADGVVLNAPQVANGTGLHEKVLSINFVEKKVTLKLTAGLYHGKEILYLSTDASDPVAATLEESTLAPNLDAAPGIASNDPAFSARAAIVVIVNGETGVDNPERQGLVSAILGEGSPLNVTEIHPRNKGRRLDQRRERPSQPWPGRAQGRGVYRELPGDVRGVGVPFAGG